MQALRPDRIATLYFFHPLRRLLGREAVGIPILMYHSISDGSEPRRNAYFHTRTSPRVFWEHLSLLAREGYKTIGLGEAVRKLKQGAGGDEKLVVLTFDDGFADFYTEAFPALNTFGYTATMFLPTAYIGDSPREFNGTTCLTWNQVRELHGTGIEFGSHTVTHPQLTTLPASDIEREVLSSKREIEDRLGAPAVSFSYPYRFPETNRAFRQTFRETLRRAGYESGVSTIIGTADSASDPLFLERVPVNSGDDGAFFAAKLQRGYEWLHGLQYASKLRVAS
jgi:peptidoglycan/xylan/chitin deacetylase (PgdA/CDA1 family)